MARFSRKAMGEYFLAVMDELHARADEDAIRAIFGEIEAPNQG